MAIVIEVLKGLIFKNSKLIEVCDKYIHPSYDEDRLENDIAILKFCNPIKLSNVIHPISFKLPKRNKNFQLKEKNHYNGQSSYYGKIYMAGILDLKPFSTWTNVVDLSLLKFDNVYENQKIDANNFLVQKGDSGHPLWWTDKDSNQSYQVSLYLLHELISKMKNFLSFNGISLFLFFRLV